MTEVTSITITPVSLPAAGVKVTLVAFVQSVPAVEFFVTVVPSEIAAFQPIETEGVTEVPPKFSQSLTSLIFVTVTSSTVYDQADGDVKVI